MLGLVPILLADFTVVCFSPFALQLLVILAAGPTDAQLVPFDQPLPCMTSPIPRVEAGADLLFEYTKLLILPSKIF